MMANPLIGYQGLDAEYILNPEPELSVDFNIKNYPPIVIDMFHINGKCENTLSALYEQLISKYKRTSGEFFIHNWGKIFSNVDFDNNYQDVDSKKVNSRLKQILQHGNGYGPGAIIPYYGAKHINAAELLGETQNRATPRSRPS